jgi:demethylmenaquinone methyltransferase/2-methoxy-6-polyprenyl-1,4-benzoquinol methylase
VHDEEAQQQKAGMQTLFTRIAARYDLVNTLISLGQDQDWRNEALSMANVPPTGKLLDVATGTGCIALTARRRYPELHVTGVDLTPAMVVLAQHKKDGDSAAWSISDGLALPFPDDTFDAVISGFMMRNVPDVAQAFVEQRRVVRPGGRVVCLEITWPANPLMSLLFKGYFFGWASLVGYLVSGNVEAYRYLPRSVKGFVSPEIMVKQMQDVGLKEVTRHLRMLGTTAIYVGVK